MSSARERERSTIKLATWNIHGGIGGDRRHDLERVVRVLHEIDADVVALQEVDRLAVDDGLLHWVQRDLGVKVVTARTLTRRNVDFGNALLSRLPITRSDSVDLTVAHHEPRNAIDVRLAVEDHELRVMATHLGLRPYERREQVQRILCAHDKSPLTPTIVMGDVNEWYLWGRPLRWLHRRFNVAHAPATFPARRPMLKLDRIWGHPAGALHDVTVHRSALARLASDHLPVVAQFRLPEASSASES